MLRSLSLVIVLTMGTATAGSAQSPVAPRPSRLFDAAARTHQHPWVVADTVQDKKVAAAIGFGVAGALMGALLAGGGDDGGILPASPTIFLFAAFGMVAGYVTGGKSTE